MEYREIPTVLEGLGPVCQWGEVMEVIVLEAARFIFFCTMGLFLRAVGYCSYREFL